jgi:hypothetical protein
MNLNERHFLRRLGGRIRQRREELGWTQAELGEWCGLHRTFISWLGLCPQHRGSGGKIFKRRIRRGANRVARALRMAAQGCHHAKNAPGAFYRRIQARAGGAKALVATARKLAERVYRLLKHGQDYVRQSQEAYEQAYRLRLEKSLAKNLASLGYKLVPVSADAGPTAARAARPGPAFEPSHLHSATLPPRRGRGFCCPSETKRLKNG